MYSLVFHKSKRKTKFYRFFHNNFNIYSTFLVIELFGEKFIPNG